MAMPQATYNFTVDEYRRMGEAGIFEEDDRVELIHGQIVQMSPIGPRHAACVNRLLALFAPLLPEGATLSVQNPVVLDLHDEPQPDLVLLRFRADGYQAALPRPDDVLLVIEVADTTPAYDRNIKAPLYATAGIAEYWLVNLAGGAIEIHRGPRVDRYADVRPAGRGTTTSPLAFPELELQTDTILG